MPPTLPFNPIRGPFVKFIIVMVFISEIYNITGQETAIRLVVSWSVCVRAWLQSLRYAPQRLKPTQGGALSARLKAYPDEMHPIMTRCSFFR
jgi:hypothetical protein